MDGIRLKARAKINLGLDVLGVRDNGYHEVRMIMQTVGLYDRIIMNKIREPEIQIQANLSYIPLNENNLMYKAAKLLMEEFHITGGVAMDLNKFIPVAAGMAGGSSDAATVLFGMNRMYDLGLSMEELMQRGVTIGADVPYCLMRGTALAEGIGEKLTRLAPMPHCAIVVAKPAVSVSTKMVYERLDLNGVDVHPDIDGIIAGIQQKNLDMVAQKMGNVLEDVTIPMHPVIDKIKTDMMKHGAVNAMMSGSGPTVFGMFYEMKDAKKCLEYLRTAKDAKQVYTTEIYNV